MARLKRYELYEDGETISQEYEPAPREEAAKPARSPAEEPRNRYFARREDDGLGASPLFDDFDRFNPLPETENRKRRARNPSSPSSAISSAARCRSARSRQRPMRPSPSP